MSDAFFLFSTFFDNCDGHDANSRFVDLAGAKAWLPLFNIDIRRLSTGSLTALVMALNFPYTYISCPCSDPSRRALSSKRTSREVNIDDILEHEDSTFDPKSPRAAFSLFPPEHLLYCEDCQDLKCHRCTIEEIVCTYCPQCLFDAVPSSIKADGNRCSRNCYMCPICHSQLNTSALSSSKPIERPYILNCQYCMWTSLESGIDFANPSQIRQQMDRKLQDSKDLLKSPSVSKHGAFADISKARGSSALSKEYLEGNDSTRPAGTTNLTEFQRLDPQAQFNALKGFYKDQLAISDANQGGSSLDAAFSSPSSLTRLLNLYGSGGNVLRKQKPKTAVMREAINPSEGLQLSSLSLVDKDSQPFSYEDTVTPEQAVFQYPASIGNPAATHVSQLKPMPTPLRTKRSKRCAACKHILVKPELKVTSTRYRIKLVALSYIPSITLKPVPVPGGLLPAGLDGDQTVKLQPGKPSQWILTLRNPLYEEVSVSLGSPNITPGKHGHKVTILCPQFSIGKNGDVWDDNALSQTVNKSDTQVAMGLGGEQVAGKVYDRGRNWTSIVIEVVPASMVKHKDERMEEDEDVIEVPIRIRLEWQVTDESSLRDESTGKKDDDGEVDDGSRQISYWMVVGVGRVSL